MYSKYIIYTIYNVIYNKIYKYIINILIIIMSVLKKVVLAGRDGPHLQSQLLSCLSQEDYVFEASLSYILILS